MSWTDERIATLKKMWKDGHSAADIAKKLGDGVTRNAVIGKAHRMGLSGRPSPIKKTAAPKKAAKKTEEKKAAPPAAKKKQAASKPEPKVQAKAKPPAKESSKPAAEKKTAKDAGKKVKKAIKATQEEIDEIRLEAEKPPEGGGVALIDLTERMCKWPYGDPQEDDFTFCGKESYPGKPYCADHVLLAYQASSKSRAAAKVKDIVIEDEDEEGIDVEDVDEDEVDEDEVGVAD